MSSRIGLLMSHEILEALEGLYPARPPDPKDTEREIWMKAGECRMIAVLKSKLLEAEENRLGV